MKVIGLMIFCSLSLSAWSQECYNSDNERLVIPSGKKIVAVPKSWPVEQIKRVQGGVKEIEAEAEVETPSTPSTPRYQTEDCENGLSLGGYYYCP